MTGDAGPPGSMRAEAEACLREMAGADARLRRYQWTARALAADHVRAGRGADGVGPTVYFTATALLRASGTPGGWPRL